ncbi:hypothetical protein DVH24_016851 [Malus domestica]|uniref:Uncharacterized protein n=1 Tax=Malus domestica TaxID=3750 RepID=A0A498HTB6_MALDO|nr:hypothetical protein DVH24_016851 [Malus domestica]
MRYKTLTAFSYHRGDQEAALKSLAPPVFIALTALKVNQYQGKPVLGNTSSTMCFFNPDIPQLTKYKQRFQYLNLPLEILPSSVESYAKPHVTADSELKTIEELFLLDHTLNKDTKFMCRVTIVGFDLSKGLWYKSYPSCHKDAKKMSTDFECYEHGLLKTLPEPWFKINFILRFGNQNKEFPKTDFVVCGLFEDQPPSATATSLVELCTPAANVEKQIVNAATPASFAALEPCAQEIQLPASNKTVKRALFVESEAAKKQSYGVAILKVVFGLGTYDGLHGSVPTPSRDNRDPRNQKDSNPSLITQQNPLRQTDSFNLGFSVTWKLES